MVCVFSFMLGVIPTGSFASFLRHVMMSYVSIVLRMSSIDPNKPKD